MTFVSFFSHIDNVSPPNVCFGSLADIGARISDVRFTPESGHAQHLHQCLLRAISRLRCAGLGCHA